MNERSPGRGPFPKAHEDAKAAERHVDSSQTRSPSYKLAFQDGEFLLKDELRPVRLQLELLKPELVQLFAPLKPPKSILKHWPDTCWLHIIEDGAHLRVAGNMLYAIDALQVAIHRPAHIESQQ